MITYNKLVNIVVFYILVQNWKFESIDYLKEKYHRIFNDYPDIIKTDFEFNNKLTEYKDLWKLDNINDNDIKILNFCYELVKLKKSEGLKPKVFLDIYNQFFNSFDSINKNYQIILLHDKLKQVINNYIDSNEIFKFLYIRQKLTLNEK